MPTDSSPRVPLTNPGRLAGQWALELLVHGVRIAEHMAGVDRRWFR